MIAYWNGLPLLDADIFGETEGIELISLVEFPAIERDFIAFKNKVRFSLNDEKRILTGPALIPDQKIYRRDDDGTEYYLQFSREAIQHIVQKFFSDANSSNVNIEHRDKADNIFYFESYLIDREKGILPTAFSDLPDGTWMVSAKVNNDEVWKRIKEGELNGFSVEGIISTTYATMHSDKPLNTLEDLGDFLGFLQK